MSATSTPTQDVAPLLNRAQAAQWLGITPSALSQLNYRGTGPTFITVGRRNVRYRMSDLVAYVEANTHTQTGSAA